MAYPAKEPRQVGEPESLTIINEKNLNTNSCRRIMAKSCMMRLDDAEPRLSVDFRGSLISHFPAQHEI
jgi:hypothetical protein